MGWVDGFGPSLATVVAFGWPGLEEHLRQIRDEIKRERENVEKLREENDDKDE